MVAGFFLFSADHVNLFNGTGFVLGVFKWDSKGFGARAKDIRLIDCHILSARLKPKDGSWTKKPVTVDLAERIENLNGTLYCHSEQNRHQCDSAGIRYIYVAINTSTTSGRVRLLRYFILATCSSDGPSL